MDPALWKIENYLEFMEARKVLLAAELNRRLKACCTVITMALRCGAPISCNVCRGGVESEMEEAELEALIPGCVDQGLPRGTMTTTSRIRRR